MSNEKDFTNTLLGLGMLRISATPEHSLYLCPFDHCSMTKEKSNPKFNLKKSTGQWRCFYCESSGNIYTLITMLQKEKSKHSKVEVAKGYSKLKNCPYKPILDLEPFEFNGEWFFPIKNKDGNVVNLLKYHRHHNTIFGLKYLPSKPLTFSLKNPNKHIIVEGLSSYAVARECYPNFNTTALFGAGNNYKFLLDHNDDDFYLFTDNDQAGKQANQRITETIGKKTSVIIWDSKLADGYDIKDLYNDCKKDISLMKSKIKVKAIVPQEKSVPAYSLVGIINEMKKTMFINANYEYALTCAYAASFSHFYQKDPVWSYIVGPASCGKTTMLEIVGSQKDLFVTMTKFTGLHSGWVDDSEEAEEMISTIKDRTLIIKDFTAVLGMSKPDQERIFSELRDLYDTESNVKYRNGKKSVWKDTCFTMLAAVTGIIDKESNHSLLGERFLKIRMKSDTNTEAKQAEMAMNNILGKFRDNKKRASIVTDALLNKSSLFTKRIADNHQKLLADITLSKNLLTKIYKASRCVALIRASIDKDKITGELNVLPENEGSTRLVSQLTKMAICLKLVMENDDENKVEKYILQLAYDTAKGMRTKILTYLIANQATPAKCTREHLEKSMNMAKTSLNRLLETMIQLSIITKEKLPETRASMGRYKEYFKISEVLMYQWVFERVDE